MSFEERLGELLHEDDEGPVRLDPGVIIAGARRRRARRTVGTVAVAAGVAGVCLVTAVTLGNARGAGGAAGVAGAALTPTATAPSASPSPVAGSIPVEPSPVRQVAPGEKVDVVPGHIRIWVTANETCDESWSPEGGWGANSGCHNAGNDNVDHSLPSLYRQSSISSDRIVATGFYLGPTPARITAYRDGTPTTATLVTTTGMNGWTAYYVVLPGVGDGPGTGNTPAIVAYDAEGRELAELPGSGPDGPAATAPTATGWSAGNGTAR
ncbi:hypothetical protein ACWEQL_22850 [Kitasatospora sp. NPDC004240]